MLSQATTAPVHHPSHTPAAASLRAFLAALPVVPQGDSLAGLVEDGDAADRPYLIGRDAFYSPDSGDSTDDALALQVLDHEALSDCHGTSLQEPILFDRGWMLSRHTIAGRWRFVVTLSVGVHTATRVLPAECALLATLDAWGVCVDGHTVHPMDDCAAWSMPF